MRLHRLHSAVGILPAMVAFAVVASAMVAPATVGAQRSTYPAGVERVVESARAQGLPPGSILTKAAQGVQLHRPDATIVSVAEAEAKRLGIARTLLGAGAPDADLQAGATALSYKIPNSALTAIRQARPTASVAVPLGVLTQLVNEGDPVASATQAVVGVMRRGVTDPQLVALGQQIIGDVANGGMPIDLATTLRFRGLTAALPSGGANVGVAGVGSHTALTNQPSLPTAGTVVKPPVVKPPGGKPPLR